MAALPKLFSDYIAPLWQALKSQVTTADLPGITTLGLNPLGISTNDAGTDFLLNQMTYTDYTRAITVAQLKELGVLNANGVFVGAAAPAVSVTGVTLDAVSGSVLVNGTRQLMATVAPTNATNKTLSWSSSNSAVATVDSAGLVTALATGNTTITVTTADGAKVAAFTLTVTASTVAVTGVALTPSSGTLLVGATQQLAATLSPANATTQTVSYATSNASIATVSAAGLVTAVAAGTATITVTTTDGSKTATYASTVGVPASFALSINQTFESAGAHTADFTMSNTQNSVRFALAKTPSDAVLTNFQLFCVPPAGKDGFFNPGGGDVTTDITVAYGGMTTGVWGFYAKGQLNGGALYTTPTINVTCTTAPTPLAAPAGLVATPTSGNSANVSWSAVANAIGYQVQRATDSAFTTGVVITYSGTALSYIGSGLTPNATYYYRVLAKGTNSFADSPYSPNFTLNTPATEDVAWTSANGTGTDGGAGLAVFGNNFTYGTFAGQASGNKGYAGSGTMRYYITDAVTTGANKAMGITSARTATGARSDLDVSFYTNKAGDGTVLTKGTNVGTVVNPGFAKGDIIDIIITANATNQTKTAIVQRNGTTLDSGPITLDYTKTYFPSIAAEVNGSVRGVYQAGTLTAVTAAARKLTPTDLATGTGTDNQPYTTNTSVDTAGTVTATDNTASQRARYNLKLPAGLDGWARFKVPASGRSSRILLRTSLLAPPGPSYQVRRGIRIVDTLQPQTVSGDGTNTGTDTIFPAVAAGTYIFISREGAAVKYYRGVTADGSDKVLITTDTDPTNGGDLWLASAGDAGASTLLEVYTSGFVAFVN